MTIAADTPKAPPARAKKHWGWLVVLVAIFVVIGAGAGSVAVSNAVATSRYADGGAAILRIPRFGEEYAVPVVAGTSLADLRRGVGWYEGTAGPGQIGNFALTGHRLGWGQPFADLGSLRVDDEIEVSAEGTTYTYRVITGPTVVSDDQSSVLAPVPGDPGRAPTKALITLITAASLLPSPDRLIVVGELVG